MAYIMNMKPDRFSIDYLLQENFYDTDSVLISDRFLSTLSEAQKMSLADMMGTGSLKHSEKKLAHLNRKKAFLDLPETRGNITKSKSYKYTKQCLSMLKPIIEKGKGHNTVEALTAFQTAEAAMSNLEKNVHYFEKAYDTNDSANILAYQTIGIAELEFISIILINCTSFTENNSLIYRDPPKNSLMKNILYKHLVKFNDICRNNKLKLNEELERKIEEYEMTYNEAAPALIAGIAASAAANPLVAGVATVAATAAGILALIYIVRGLICFFYFVKIDISETLKYISGMVEANSMSVANGDPKNKTVAQRQTNVASSLKKLGDALDNDVKQAQVNAEATLKKEDMQTSRSIESTINPDNRQEVTPRSSLDNLGDDNLFI